jgi:DNA-binding GntR family transcriptional regulator
VPTPRVRTLAADLEVQIRAGAGPAGAADSPANLGAGCRLHSRAELADLYGVSQSTVYAALELLKERRLVRGEPGRAGLLVRPVDEWLPVPPPDDRTTSAGIDH